MLKIGSRSGLVWGVCFFCLGLFTGLKALSFSSNSSSVILVWEGFSEMCTPLGFYLFFDSESLWFLSTVSIISSGVMLFSVFYMAEEKFYVRFILILLSFVLSMMLLITSPGLLSIFIGWDGLGVTSFLLVIYFFSNKSLNAGLLTLLTNRLGDIFLLMGVSVVWSSFGGELTSLQGSGFSLSGMSLGVIFLASMTKSAQIPFSSWLPAAMAAPTPVSALVHSSTLVTAGLYLLIRFSGGLESSVWWEWGLFFSSLTLMMASLSSLTEMDMKKIVALSTLSQLGLIGMAISAQTMGAAFFHLIMHAYFKALLFMLMGFWIHQSLSYQDLRAAGIFSQEFSLSVSMTLLALMSLSGIPYFAGFFSKDLILELLSFSSWLGLVSYSLLVMGCVLTVVYSLRLLITLMGRGESVSVLQNWSEKSSVFYSALVCLMMLSIGGGKFLGFYVFGDLHFVVVPQELKLILSSLVLIGLILSAGLMGVKRSERLLGNLGYLWGLSYLSFPWITTQSLVLSAMFEKVELLWLPFLSSGMSVNSMIKTSQVLGSYSLVSFQGYSGFQVIGAGVLGMVLWSYFGMTFDLSSV
uniref:NADH-ubiquinone oxidoreductase chain 5 n=1 Tax=Tigriopus japonicus TaxID=158387 RepID=Q8M6U4_TIGJA|nr:NADH dehydrogenase subunit 5 [Tigriopus japonicus]